MQKDTKPASRLSRFIKAMSPIRVLTQARDFYVRSLTNCAGQVSYGAAMGAPFGSVPKLPKSFSTNSSRASDDEDLRELMRAVSQRRLATEKIETPPSLSASRRVPRSQSVGIGKIDEDKPCYFPEENLKGASLYPRSRSYAVTKGRRGLYS